MLVSANAEMLKGAAAAEEATVCVCACKEEEAEQLLAHMAGAGARGAAHVAFCDGNVIVSRRVFLRSSVGVNGLSAPLAPDGSVNVIT